MQNKIKLHVKYLLNVNSLEIIWSSSLLLILIKNAIKNAVKAVISLYMVCLENPENQNSEIAANEITHVNLHLMNNVTIKYYRSSKFSKFTGRHLCPSLKKGSGTGIFLWILRNF